MLANKNLPYYLIIIAIFLLLKLGFTRTDTEDLAFLLQPTDTLVGLLTGSHAVYASLTGYYHENIDVLIDKSCAGFNFWIMSFLIFTYLTIKYVDNSLVKVITIPITLFGTYLLTIIVNTSRIFASIVIQTQTKTIFQNQQHFIHESIGIITNVSFLVLCYVLTEKYLSKKRDNAKFT